MCTKLMVLGEVADPWKPCSSSQLQFPLVRQSLDPISQGPAGSASIINSQLLPWPTKYACPSVKQGATAFLPG